MYSSKASKCALCKVHHRGIAKIQFNDKIAQRTDLCFVCFINFVMGQIQPELGDAKEGGRDL